MQIPFPRSLDRADLRNDNNVFAPNEQTSDGLTSGPDLQAVCLTHGLLPNYATFCDVSSDGAIEGLRPRKTLGERQGVFPKCDGLAGKVHIRLF